MIDFDFSLLVLTRIIFAVLLGFGIGLEREMTNKYAGLRTHILVCLGSCVFTILSIYAFPAAVGGSHGDPARISAQILTGIGFIGGGTVLRHGSSVYGLTTAATLWMAAAIGMSCGAGMLNIGVIATIFSVGVLVLIRLFETNVLVHSTKNIKRIKILAVCYADKAEGIHKHIVEKFDYVHEISKKRDENDNQLVKIEAIIDVNDKKPIKSMYEKFQNVEGLDSITIQENDE